MNKLELIAKLEVTAVKISESPFTISTLGTIAPTELESFVSKKGNSYLKAGNYLIACKPEVLTKAEDTIKVLTANKDYKQMKAGEAFAVAE